MKKRKRKSLRPGGQKQAAVKSVVAPPPNLTLPNYNPPFGPFTETWDDLVNEKRKPLHFGALKYKTSTDNFSRIVKPSAVKTALTLLSYLKLEKFDVEDDESLMIDSSMRNIKDSSEGVCVHFNSIGKPNKKFAWFVIDFLAMSILFDTYSHHRSLKAPVLYNNATFSTTNENMLVHNKHILIKFCIDQGNSWVKDYFIDKKTGKVASKGCVDLNKLWATSNMYLRQFNAGIIYSFQSYTNSNTDEKKEQKLWIHHFMILQLFHPSITLSSDDIVDDNHANFVDRIAVNEKQKYNLHYDWRWLGSGGKRDSLDHRR